MEFSNGEYTNHTVQGLIQGGRGGRREANALQRIPIAPPPQALLYTPLSCSCQTYPRGGAMVNGTGGKHCMSGIAMRAYTLRLCLLTGTKFSGFGFVSI